MLPFQQEYKDSIKMLIKVLDDIDPQTNTADEIKTFLINQFEIMVDMAGSDMQ